MEIYFVTSNKDKLREMKQLLKTQIKSKALDLDEIQDIDVQRVAKDKVIKAYYAIRKPVIIEDTGIYIKSLNGFPGALCKWLLKSIGNDGLCEIMMGYKDKSIYAETWIAFYDGKTLKTFSGRLDGTVSDSPRGGNGFGWDQIFIPKGHKVTFAEMKSADKNRISMRKKAALKLKAYLKSRK